MPSAFLFRYLIRPSSLSPKPSPLIDERKLLQAQRQQYTRGEPTGADKSELAQVDAEAKQKSGGRIVKDGNSRVSVCSISIILLLNLC